MMKRATQVVIIASGFESDSDGIEIRAKSTSVDILCWHCQGIAVRAEDGFPRRLQRWSTVAIG